MTGDNLLLQTGDFEVILTVKDQNTASPTFDSSAYSVNVSETLPVGLVIPGLVLSASGKYDAVENAS